MGSAPILQAPRALNLGVYAPIISDRTAAWRIILSKSLYDELEVPENATGAEIKHAYRRKAKKVHPDVGGKPEEFAPIAHAYKILSDDKARLHYDTTGEEKQQPLEVEVRNIMLTAFNQALSQDGDIEVLAFVRKGLEGGKLQIPAEIRKLKDREKKLKAKRGKIQAKSTNLVHAIIDQELHLIAGALAQLKHQQEVNAACLEALADYSEDWEAPKPSTMTISLGNMMRNYQNLGPTGGVR